MPKTAFEHTIARAKAVVDFHKKVQVGTGRGRPPRHLSDVLRGALVLSVAGLDAAILDLVVTSIPTLARQGRLGLNVSKWIDERPGDTLLCFAEEKPHEALAALCREALGNRTFQKAEQIEGILRETLGCEPPWSAAAERLTTKRKGWTSERVKAKLTEYVARRNRIAHDGDTMPSGKAREIQRLWVEEGIAVVEAVGLAAQAIVRVHIRPAKAQTAATRQRTIRPVAPLTPVEPVEPATATELPHARSA